MIVILYQTLRGSGGAPSRGPFDGEAIAEDAGCTDEGHEPGGH
jgi:hypothetical protein